MEHENTSQTKQPEVTPSAKAEEEIPSGGDLFLIQPKLTVGDVDDPLEAEADAVADQVMRTDTQPFVQRKCAHCEEEERAQRKPMTDFISRKATESSSQPVSSPVSQAIQQENGKGNAMQGPVMDFMESRFGSDFSDVNIHTGSKATDLTAQLKAQAFTVGNDIYFNDGKYSPETDSGKHLLAHELTHTIQQGNNKLIQRSGETGTSVDENVASAPTRNPDEPGVIRGTVVHSQYRNEADRAAGTNPFNRTNINLRFDENECKIYVSRTVQFVHHSDGEPTQCRRGAVDPVRRVSNAAFRRIANRFLRANNEGLNDWFKIRLRNATASRCNNRDIPIIVEVTETDTNPDTTVVITGNSGRSYVSGDENRARAVLCDGPDYGTMVHESGHMTLGYDDEYRERDNGPAERERTTEFSYMDAHNRLSIFHERHFDFVRAFMENLYAGSQATLMFGSRSRYFPSFTFGGTVGGAGGDYQGLFYSIGIDMNIPLDVLRRTEISIGPRLGFLAGDVKGLGARESVVAILYGVRLGFLGTFDTRMFNSQVPLGVGLHLEGGGGHNFDASTTAPDFKYLEFGGSLGYRGNRAILGLDFGVGTLDLNRAPGVSTPDMSDPRLQTYVRLGFDAAFRF